MASKRTTISVLITEQEYDQNDVADPATRTTSLDYQVTLPLGTGQVQADRAYVSRSGAYVASTAQDHDLNPFTDSFGNGSQSIAKLRLLAFRAENTVAGQTWTILGDANSVPILNTAATTMNVGPNGLVLIVNPIDGYTVTAATGDIIQATPPAAATSATLIAAGSSV